MVDASIAIGFALPYFIFSSLVSSYGGYIQEVFTERQLFIIYTILMGILVSTCFISPIIYLIFNSYFRVSL